MYGGGEGEIYGFSACYKLRKEDPTQPIHNPDCVTLFALGKFARAVTGKRILTEVYYSIIS